jgi:CRISPR-associated protein Cas2
MLFVVAYDVADDDVRARLSQTLLRFGTRVQESVFECRLDRTQLDRMVTRCGPILKRDPNGHLRVYQICQTCERGAFGLGKVTRPSISGPAIVV